MKYEPVLGNLKEKITQAQNILIALPAKINIDKLASGLSLYLALDQSNKNTAIVTEDIIKVSHTNLYGVGKVANQLPDVSGGDLTISLEGVVAEDGTVTSLEKLDWYPEGKNLNLVFHVLPGQKFEPKNITPKFTGGKLDLIICIGVANLEQLGNLYNQNKQIFIPESLVNIDNSQDNTSFGQINIIDTQASSTSEMILQILPDLGLSLDQDIATNIITGIYDQTNNLTTNISPDAFFSVGVALQNGGKIPQPTPSQVIEQQEAFKPTEPEQPATKPSALAPIPEEKSQPMVNPIGHWFDFSQNNQPPNTPSAEETPQGEQATTPSPETDQPAPDWLTPKIYKGGNIE